MNEEKLIKMAIEASKFAYSKYSSYSLGAALLATSGRVYTGCNVENSSFGLTNCAERSAIFNALSCGEREFEKIYIYVDSEKIFPPCGACRQVLAEFCKPNFEIIYFNQKKEPIRTTLGELLPQGFVL